MSDEKTAVGAKVSPKLKKRIDDYQESEGFVNRSDAIRSLITDSLDRHESSPSVPSHIAVMWLGTFAFAIGLEPAADAATGIMLAGIVIIILGIIEGRKDLLSRFRQ